VNLGCEVNDNKPLVSIIVPVYNVKNFVSECLDSILNQTLKNIEVICINDGSTDGSDKIVEQYAKNDSRIKYFSQNNQGLSVTRNNGIKKALADYIMFVDSDDWIDKDFVEKLYNAAIENNAQIAAGSILRYRKSSQKYRVCYPELKIYTDLKDKIEACSIPKCCYVWNKLYSKELISDFQKGVFFEDVLWIPEVIKKANKLVVVPEVKYYYRVNSNSIVKKLPSIKKQEDSYRAKKYIFEFFEQNNIPLSDKAKKVTKRIYYFLNIPVLKVKEFNEVETCYLFGLLPIFKTKGNN